MGGDCVQLFRCGMTWGAVIVTKVRFGKVIGSCRSVLNGGIHLALRLDRMMQADIVKTHAAAG